MTVKDMETSRDKLLDAILTRVKAWDSDLEAGIEIIGKNEIDIKKLQELEDLIHKESSKLEDERAYENKISDLRLEMKNFLEKMEEKKKILLEEKKTFGKNNDIITNYISSDLKAAFIDKNV